MNPELILVLIAFGVASTLIFVALRIQNTYNGYIPKLTLIGAGITTINLWLVASYGTHWSSIRLDAEIIGITTLIGLLLTVLGVIITKKENISKDKGIVSFLLSKSLTNKSKYTYEKEITAFKIIIPAITIALLIVQYLLYNSMVNRGFSPWESSGLIMSFLGYLIIALLIILQAHWVKETKKNIKHSH